MTFDLDSFGLTDEVKEKIKSAYEADVAGLKNKNAELVERERKAKEASEASHKAELEATEAQEQAKIALAEKSGDIEKYKAAVAESEGKIKALKLEFQEKENQRIVGDAVHEFSRNVSDDPAAQVYMKGIFQEAVEVVEGKLRPKDVTLSMEQLTQKLVADESHKKYIKADVGSGAGSAGSDGENSFEGKKFSDMTLTEKSILANKNPDLYNSLSKVN